MTKESESRPGDGWPRSAENSCSTVSKKGKMVSRWSLVELGGHVEAIRPQRTTNSPCTTNLGRGGEDLANFGFNQAHWWNCEYLAVVHGTIYRHDGPTNDQRPRNTSLMHGDHVTKEHSDVEWWSKWHDNKRTKPRWPPMKYLWSGSGQVRGTVTRLVVISPRSIFPPIHSSTSGSTVPQIFSSFFRYFLRSDLHCFTESTSLHPLFLLILVKNRAVSINMKCSPNNNLQLYYRIYGSNLHKFSDLVLSNRLHFTEAIVFWIHFLVLFNSHNLCLTAQLHNTSSLIFVQQPSKSTVPKLLHYNLALTLLQRF
jgi:hypothetical protein